MNFKEFFVDYQNILNYVFLKKISKQIIINDQERIEPMFNLDEVFFNRNFTIGKKHCEFLKLRTFHTQLLDELVDFFYFYALGTILNKKKMKFLLAFEKQMLYGYLKKMLGASAWSHMLFKKSVGASAGCTNSFGNFIF